MTHTPGPWYPGHFGTEGKCQCRSIVSDGQYVGGIATVHTDNGLPISEGGNDAPKRDEAIANMHLISAAPELLDALRDCLMHLRENFKDDSSVWVDRGRSAIAKAEGR